VTRIVDVETVALDDGREVRLAGIIAPRARDVAGSAPWPVEAAARRAISDLLIGRTVGFRRTSGRDQPDTDRYGRLVVQLFLIEGEGLPVWVQGSLVARGLARAGDDPGSPECTQALIELEEAPRVAGRGLWALGAYRIRRAMRTAELWRDRGTFQLIEGRVVKAERTRRGLLILSFTSQDGERRRGLSVRVAPKAAMALGLGRGSGLADRIVRVRGWIEVDRGLVVDASSASGLSVIESFTRYPPRRPEPRPPRPDGLVETLAVR
jgi:endonuclease YncB( thermonuclease family)